MPDNSSGAIPSGTESRSEATRDIDRVPVAVGLAMLASESRHAFEAFRDGALELAPIVDAVVACVRAGGTVHLFGAGSSGRLAALDAAELPPTFGIPPMVFRAHLAGGPSAMTTATENAEDDVDEGARVGGLLEAGDVAIGVTASGRTPFVLSALTTARSRRAFTALIDCNPSDSPRDIDCHVTLHTGAEAIAGSTRLNAATAQKLALNAISTLAMVHLGKTYSNLMVSVQPTNEKLRHRQVRMLREISGAPEAEVVSAIAAAGSRGDIALAMLAQGWDAAQAATALDRGASLRRLVDDPD
jgi:N-acetylmuramic acid 6-phosphate etherase